MSNQFSEMLSTTKPCSEMILEMFNLLSKVINKIIAIP